MSESKVVDILSVLRPADSGVYGVALPTPGESEEFREMFAELFAPAEALA